MKFVISGASDDQVKFDPGTPDLDRSDPGPDDPWSPVLTSSVEK